MWWELLLIEKHYPWHSNCAQVSADSNLSMSDSNQQGVRINLRRMDLSAFINYRP